MKNWMKIFCAVAVLFVGCSSPTNGETGSYEDPKWDKSSSSKAKVSSSSAAISSESKSSSSGISLSISWIKTGNFRTPQTEVMQSDYQKLMGELPPQMAKAVGDSFPVSNVSWYDAILFANELSKVLGLDTAYSYTSRGAGNKLGGFRTDAFVSAVRLPSREEWEYAARAGSTGNYYWGTSPAKNYAQYNRLTDSYQKVAQKQPNAWGIYDVSGNVSEWTADTALCGGDWTSVAKDLALKNEEKKLPDYTSMTTGFRVIRTGE